MTSPTNHPNRSKSAANPCRSPSGEEIALLRRMVGLTQEASATLVCYSRRGWQLCETGERRMHPAAWMLYRIRVEPILAAAEARAPDVILQESPPAAEESPAPSP